MAKKPKKKPRENLTRPRQHVIDDIAKGILINKLPKHWIRNELPSDYGKDFLVELVDGTDVTGKHFIVQLKGTDDLKRLKSGLVSFQMETVHLAYYQTKMIHPVFLVVVDTKTEDAFFTFVQGLLSWDETSRPKRTTQTLHLRPEDKLDDEPRLLAAVERSLVYMRERYPGSVDAAVANETKQLVTIDSRFKYDVSFNDGKKHIQITPTNEPVPVKLNLLGEPEHTRKAWQQLIDFGEQIESTSDVQIELIGSPLFEHAGKIASLVVGAKQPLEIMIGLPHGDSLLPVLVCQTEMTVARKRFRASFSLPNCPFTGEVICTIDPDRRRIFCNFNYRWKPEVWAKKPLTFIPWFDKVCLLVDAMQEGGPGLGLCLSSQGFIIGAQDISAAQLKPLAPIRHYLDLLKMARFVAQVTGLPLLIPDDWSEEDESDIEELWQLFTEGYYSTSGVTLRPVLKVDPSAPLPDMEESGVFRLTSAMKYNIFGFSFEMPGAYYEFRDWKEARYERDPNDPTNVPMVLEHATMHTIWESCPLEAAPSPTKTTRKH